ncbi:rhodanese-like/PpiC domain-containing protein 12, chloroplastic [Prosopis cineraria]|uniref:rhodanese-like/PpiC domain-containing protein 12, chloroplastic n=1 Tax=Prosopis cineraria TaxID=364024 RepID=UPI002410A02E|nr:rhodanese-like/PpiC domain-containing protein 12, chloroplastic [Prosopis cineraria]
MLRVRASHFPMIASPALSALRLSLIPNLSLSSPSNLRAFFTCSTSRRVFSHGFLTSSHPLASFNFKQLLPTMGLSRRQVRALCSSSSRSAEGSREILVQHLLVKEDDQKLLLDLQQRISSGEDLSDLAVEHSICPSKEEGGMLGWVRKGEMVPEFEEAAFKAPLNKVVRCKTKFGWHLLQVLSEREETILQDIQPNELHAKIQDPNFMEEAQLIDVREPEEVEKASLPGFKVLPLRQFGNWGPDITTTFDPNKDTYVLCHHGMRSLQVAKWLQSQGFRRVYNISGGIHAYAVKVDPSVPTY